MKPTQIVKSGIVALVALAMLACIGCAKKEQAEKPAEQAPKPLEKVVERGPVKVTLRADRSEFSIADNLNVSLIVDAEPGVDVELPQFGDSFGEFIIRDFHKYGPDVTAEKKNRWRLEYELEVYYSGDFKIPPLKVKFQDNRTEAVKPDAPPAPGKDQAPAGPEGASGRGGAPSPPGTETDAVKTADDQKGESATEPKEPSWNEIETEEAVVKATSVVQPAEEMGKIKDIAGPVSLPRPSFIKRFGLLIGITAVVAIAAGAGFALLRRKKQIERQMLPAHVLAFRMLEWLIAQDLLGKGEIELFYVHLCGIVRRYIELRFSVHAPEETTEEFLAQLSQQGDSPLAHHRTLLKEFLEHADLVKFARHRPGPVEVQQAFDSAKNFIQSTADEQVQIDVAEVAIVQGGAA